MAIKTLNLDVIYETISIVNLWYKLRNTELLALTDIPEIIKFRWAYFRDDWQFIRTKYVSLIPTYIDPDMLINHIEAFDEFIDSQRTLSINKNPLDNLTAQERFHAIFDTTLIENLTLTREEQILLDTKVQEVRAYTRNDFLSLKKTLIQERDYYTDYQSATDVDYNRIYDRSPTDGQVSLDTHAVNVIYHVQQTIKAIDYILANIFSLETATVDPFELARQNARNQEVEIGSYVSGQLTKLYYGESLQAIASRTLGDPDKWIDIAIANGLKPPYIDEVGEKIPLISNANGNQINIGPTDSSGNLNLDKLYVNQIVTLQSNTKPFLEQRLIINIKDIPISGELILELSGTDVLDDYKLSEAAHIRIYKPNTINSSFYILIPTEEPLSDEDVKTDTPWFLRESSEGDRRQKVDLALHEDTNDLILTSTDDMVLSYGLANSIQAVKLKMGITKGELRKHDDYGLVQVQGRTNEDVGTLKEVLIDSITASIQQDNRFDRIERLDIYDLRSAFGGDTSTVESNGLYIVLSVRLAGSDTVIPISFKVNI